MLPAEKWAGIPSGTYRIHALGRDRAATVDLSAMSVTLEGVGELPEHLLVQALDMIRVVTPRPERDIDAATLDELRANNAAANARGDYSCDFDSDVDPAGVPDGHDCGGCGCHLSAPCHHCMHHLPIDDSDFIGQMLDLTGRTS